MLLRDIFRLGTAMGSSRGDEGVGGGVRQWVRTARGYMKMDPINKKRPLCRKGHGYVVRESHRCAVRATG
ncbi:hypothetical protein GCM10010252_32250 [Streptomyces aureoverticillatus]|nr:hypothetical protein GCM10010252_32250 [Streptomyces aureoverticillatus]